jgi:two-component system alkaline phosphatase synthesis response regulator PhoP
MTEASEAKKKILVVDDDKEVLRVLEMLLNREGYAPICADNGEDAIRLAEQSKPDLVLLDFLMPKMDGSRTFTELRHRLGKETPFIFITGTSLRLSSELAESKKFIYLPKPVDFDKLTEAIRSLLAQ